MAKVKTVIEAIEPPATYREPDYRYRFGSEYNTLHEFLEDYHRVAIKQKQAIDKKEAALAAVRNIFFEWGLSGIVEINNTQINKLNADEHELSEKKRKHEVELLSIVDDVVFYSGILFGYFSDIQNEHTQGYITTQQYCQYLAKYQHILDTNIDVPVFKTKTVEMISKAIAQYLTAESIAA